jgi:DNA recombination protein RmuC
VWLPIDAKFPLEDYQRLLEAQERADPVALERQSRRWNFACVTRRERFTTSTSNRRTPPISRSSICRPRACMPRPCADRDWLTPAARLRICIAGPTTLAALLNSLQMGFRTLAIERRSSEVWAVLGAIKTEFGKFGEVLEATRRKLEQASRSIESAGVRTRQIERKLKASKRRSVAAGPCGNYRGMNRAALDAAFATSYRVVTSKGIFALRMALPMPLLTPFCIAR